MESCVAPLTILKDHQTASRETADHSVPDCQRYWPFTEQLLSEKSACKKLYGFCNKRLPHTADNKSPDLQLGGNRVHFGDGQAGFS